MSTNTKTGNFELKGGLKHLQALRYWKEKSNSRLEFTNTFG